MPGLQGALGRVPSPGLVLEVVPSCWTAEIVTSPTDVGIYEVEHMKGKFTW